MKIKNLWKFVLFCFVGGIATLIDLGIFNICTFLFGKTLLMLKTSRALGIGISMIWNFTMNRNITFRAKEEKVRRQLPKWFILYIITSLVNFLVFSLVITLMGRGFLERNIAFFCGIAISIPLNFIGSLLWVFKK